MLLELRAKCSCTLLLYSTELQTKSATSGLLIMPRLHSAQSQTGQPNIGSSKPQLLCIVPGANQQCLSANCKHGRSFIDEYRNISSSHLPLWHAARCTTHGWDAPPMGNLSGKTTVTVNSQSPEEIRAHWEVERLRGWEVERLRGWEIERLKALDYSCNWPCSHCAAYGLTALTSSTTSGRLVDSMAFVWQYND